MGLAKTVEASKIGRLISGTFMIAGTTVGAGMLGIPLETAKAGFLPSVVVTVLVWFFMLCTGLLFMEVSLWMPQGTNVLSMADRFFGKTGKKVAGGVFVFLYYCLLVAYFAAGAPLLNGFMGQMGVHGQSWISYLIFGSIFWLIVNFGAKWIDRANVILTAALITSYFALVGAGSSEVKSTYLHVSNWSSMFYAVPVLFSAFGYHNVIPSLSTHFNRDKKLLRISIISGTIIALLIYLVWQWIIMGSIPQSTILEAKKLGLPATQALQSVTNKPMVYLIGQYFAFFAIVTSLLGVAFSMVDFLADGLKIKRGDRQILLSFITFFPPFIFAVINPFVFDKALGIAGGFGEAILNGLFPVSLVWIGKYTFNLSTETSFLGKKWVLATLFAISLSVIALETIRLLMG